jgi:hypothetical protein
MPRARHLAVAATSRHANHHTVSTALGDMSDSHLLCRDFGHAWRPYTAHWIPQRQQYQEGLRCTRCKTVRLRLISDSGELLANRYVYADGYLVHGVGRLTGTDRDALRVAALQTVLAMVGDDAPKRGGSKRKAG